MALSYIYTARNDKKQTCLLHYAPLLHIYIKRGYSRGCQLKPYEPYLLF